MDSSAAQVIYQLLLDLVLAEESDGSWPIFISFLPDLPHVMLAVYDTAGIEDGRIMDGPKIEHHGIQVSVRTPLYLDGLRKARAIADAFDDQLRTIVDVESDTTYTIQNISRQGTILSVGVDEQDGQRRHYFTINAVVTYSVIVFDIALDKFESYTVNSNVNALNGGSGWFNIAWVARNGAFGVQGLDDFEDYSVDDDVDDLNGGEVWNGNWVSRQGFGGVQGLDDFEDYSVNDDVDALTGGDGWNGNWIARNGAGGIQGLEDFESYTPTDPVDSLSGGSGWNGNWVSR